MVGLPDPAWGEIVCAAVVMLPGQAPLDVDTVRARLADGPATLAAHKHPRRIVVVEAIPRTAATGQVQRSLLRENVAILAERGG